MTEENQGITGQKRALEDGEPSPDGAAPAEEPTDAAPAPTPEEPSAAVEATGGAAPTATGGAEVVPVLMENELWTAADSSPQLEEETGVEAGEGPMSAVSEGGAFVTCRFGSVRGSAQHEVRTRSGRGQDEVRMRSG